MLKLYFLRHADAGERSSSKYPDDSKRPLSDEGAQDMKKAAAGLARAGLRFDRVVSSPFLRARQTAEIAVRATQFTRKIALAPALVPTASFKEFTELVEQLGDGKALLVGHEPLLSLTLARLTADGHDLAVDFKKGALCCVEVTSREPLRARLKWLLTPKLMKCLRH